MEVMMHLDNLSISTTEEDLTELFGQVGEVTAVEIYRDRISGISKGYGCVAMSMSSEADRAISRFNSHLLKGHALSVRLSKPRSVSASRTLH